MSTLWQRMERERLRQNRAELSTRRLLFRAAWHLAVMLLVLAAFVAAFVAVADLLAGH